jgi:GR25 family glycosyltransferase involved in LPS biosynthesis
MKIGYYVINCMKHTERIQKFSKWAKGADISPRRVVCQDASKIKHSQICKLRTQRKLDIKADLTAVEVAINFSHLKAWKRFLKTKYEYCIVFEDDTRIFKNFKENVMETLEALQEKNINFDILWLWNGNWMTTKSKTKSVLKVNSEISIRQEKLQYNAGAVCYVLSRKFAKTLVKNIFPINDPVDIFIGSFANKGGKHLTVATKKYKNGCVKSPFVYTSCAGPYGTGKSTQEYEKPAVKTEKCKKR